MNLEVCSWMGELRQIEGFWGGEGERERLVAISFLFASIF